MTATIGEQLQAKGNGVSEIDVLKARLAQLEAEAKARDNVKLTIRVGAKGGVSVYGLGRYPVTLYQEQWGRLLNAKDDITAFITRNRDSLKVKGEAVASADDAGE